MTRKSLLIVWTLFMSFMVGAAQLSTYHYRLAYEKMQTAFEGMKIAYDAEVRRNKIEVTCVSPRWLDTAGLKSESCTGPEGEERDSLALCRGPWKAACVPKDSRPSDACRTLPSDPIGPYPGFSYFPSGEWR